MKLSKLILGVSVLWTTYGCENRHQTIDDKFNGMWRLDKYEVLDTVSSKWLSDTTRTGFNGYILYDGKGHMGVHLLLKAGYKDFDTKKNLDSLDKDGLKELVKFYQSNYVYFADYKITDSTIMHERHTATNPSDWGSVLTRDFEFRNDTLILAAQERIGGKRLRLIWVKL